MSLVSPEQLARLAAAEGWQLVTNRDVGREYDQMDQSGWECGGGGSDTGAARDYISAGKGDGALSDGYRSAPKRRNPWRRTRGRGPCER